MIMQPLAEVFGFPPDNVSEEAQRHRRLRLCPYNNRVPNCTKDKAKDPLGVCSVYYGQNTAITCPIRFRQNWLIAEDAAAFFFAESMRWTSLTEVKLEDKQGRSAGNIDVVMVAYDEQGRITNFGALKVQAVYISGNVRLPFERFMADPQTYQTASWTGANSPRPDFLSSSRKRLVPQLIYKGAILYGWGKKQAVAVDEAFFHTLPDLPQVGPSEADIAWLIYDLELNQERNSYELVRKQTVYTSFRPALDQITTPEVGPVAAFVDKLQSKLDEKFDGESNPPDAPILFEESE